MNYFIEYSVVLFVLSFLLAFCMTNESPGLSCHKNFIIIIINAHARLTYARANAINRSELYARASIKNNVRSYNDRLWQVHFHIGHSAYVYRSTYYVYIHLYARTRFATPTE